MSDSSIFKTIPYKEITPLPFKWEEKSLSNWLIDLAHCEAQQACMQILSLVQTLNRTDLAFKHQFPFLKLFNEYLSPCINRLEGSCWDSGFPLSDEENCYARLVTWNYLVLAEGFFIAAQKASKKNDAIMPLAMAVQALGQAQLHIAAIYTTPLEGFWQLFYQIFAFAEKQQLLHSAIDNNDRDFKGLTLNTLFARSLVFQGCDTNQFNARDMRNIYNFLPRVCANLPLVHHSDELDLFMFDLESDEPPHNVNSQIKLGSGSIRYFSPIKVADTLNYIIKDGNTWKGALKSINTDLFSRVVKTLQLKQKRQYHRKKEDHDLLGVIGFNDIVSFLYKIARSKLVIPNPAEKKPAAKTNMTLEKLTPFTEVFGAPSWELEKKEDAGSLKTKLATINKQMWQQNQNIPEATVKKVSLKDIKISDSSANGYSVSWNQAQSKAKIGDLFGIISEDKKRLEIAIIRRIALAAGNDFRNDVRFGAELLGFESEVIYLAKVKTPEEGALAIFIPGIEELGRPNAVIYSTGSFTVGENVYIYHGNKSISALLLKELHATTSISHVEIVFID